MTAASAMAMRKLGPVTIDNQSFSIVSRAEEEIPSSFPAPPYPVNPPPSSCLRACPRGRGRRLRQRRPSSEQEAGLYDGLDRFCRMVRGAAARAHPRTASDRAVGALFSESDPSIEL